MNLPVRRRRPRTIVGKAIRAWPKIRLALKVLRFVRRARTAIRVLLIGAAVLAGLAVVRKLRARRRSDAVPFGGVATPPPQPWGAAGRETGRDTGPETQTERNLDVEKATGDPG
jgi:hypothetical protein